MKVYHASNYGHVREFSSLKEFKAYENEIRDLNDIVIYSSKRLKDLKKKNYYETKTPPHLKNAYVALFNHC